MTGPRPPRPAEWLAGVAVPATYREEHLGDLQEGFALHAARGRSAATRWYWRQAFRSIAPGVAMRLRGPGDHPKLPQNKRSGTTMNTVLQDIRYGMLALKKSPMFALVATLTLSLAIGVNTAIFSLVSGVVFAELPMTETESVSIVRGQNPELGIDQGSVSVPDYLDLSERSSSYQTLAALTEAQWVLTSGDAPIRVQGLLWTANQLGTWKLPPVLGRDFALGEDAAGSAPVALISYPFWQTQFAGSQDVIGQVLRLDGVEHTIVGVADPKLGFASFADAQVITPLNLQRDGSERDARILFVTGRLNQGVSQARATEEAAAIGRALAQEFPGSNRGWGLWSAPVRESLINEDGKTIMTMLMLTVAFVVLIACANIANMLLARSTVRSQEMSVRTALGAGRGRLIRQLITESLVISLFAGLLGLVFAKGLLVGLIRISNGTEPAFLLAELNLQVLGFTLLVSLAAPVFFGLFPALQASKADAADTLKDGRSAGGGRASRRARSVLVGAQISLALTLMVVSGLLVRTVYNLTQREPGFDPAGLVTVALDLPEASYPTGEDRIRFYTRVQEEIKKLPALGQTALVNAVPGVGFGSLRSVEIEGRDLGPDQARPSELVITVSPDYFQVVGIPMVRGRGFSGEDRVDGPPVVVLSKEVAEQHWSGESPMGSRIRFGSAGEAPWLTVIGVAADVVAATDSERPARNIYLPYQQSAGSASYVLARSPSEPEVLAGQLRNAVWSVDPNQPVDGIASVEQLQYDDAASSYALLTLFVIFAVFALIMAGLGVYGVMAYAVSQRRAEIGLRIALGAEASAIRRMILSQGARVLFGGMAFGLVSSLLLGQLLSGLVYGISASDPLTIACVCAILGTVALTANLVPAIRATRTDPAAVLRSE